MEENLVADVEFEIVESFSFLSIKNKTVFWNDFIGLMLTWSLNDDGPWDWLTWRCVGFPSIA